MLGHGALGQFALGQEQERPSIHAESRAVALTGFAAPLTVVMPAAPAAALTIGGVAALLRVKLRSTGLAPLAANPIRTRQIPWETLVNRVDPERLRDARNVVEFEFTNRVFRHNPNIRGAYADD